MNRHRSGRAPAIAATLTLLVGVVACEEQIPTGVGGEIPAEPVTVEIELAWSEFGSNVRVFGGYGAVGQIGVGVLASNFGDSLNARTLVRLAGYPDRATVRDTTGTERTDSTLTFLEGFFVARFDTLASTNTGPVTLALSALAEEWDAASADWENAVDTTGDVRPWSVPGGGTPTPIRTVSWDPAEGDSALFYLDSAQVAAWADASDSTRGAFLESVTEGVRLQLAGASLNLTARPSVDPDTTIVLRVASERTTFVYDPQPQAPTSGLRVGGAPAWRTVLDVTAPTQITGPPEFCAIVTCPHTLTEEQISLAGLVLTTATTDLAYQPTDSLGFDARPVLDPGSLPKSPLGGSLIEGILGRRVAGAAFGPPTGTPVEVEVPITAFFRALVSGVDPTSGGEPPGTLALLTPFEPLSLTYGSFAGPGEAGEPRLRLILTIGPPVELP